MRAASSATTTIPRTSRPSRAMSTTVRYRPPSRRLALLAAGGIIGRNDVGAVSGCRNFGAVACALHAGALVGWNKKSVEDSAAGSSVNGTALTGTNYAELAVGFQDGELVVGHHLRGEIARQKIINYLTERNLL